jgi:hypothetical protein
MFNRFMLALFVAMLTAPTMYAGAFPFAASSPLPWERLPHAAANAICKHLGLCFGSIS